MEIRRESGTHSWEGVKIRKGNEEGVVIEDWNGAQRSLVVKFEDGRTEMIALNNVGLDPEYVHQYEWFSDRCGGWLRF